MASRTDACTATGGIYRPRNHRASPLYQCVTHHYDELEAGGHFTRSVEEQVLSRFIDCGNLHQGFARVYCDNCGHDYLLAFSATAPGVALPPASMQSSCKTRYFCPSCHQKRMLAYGEWVEENVLVPVPHRQYVFALPRLLRPWFRHDRARLGKLCQLVALLLVQGYQTLDPRGRPGFMLYVQTFGDLVTFNPHMTARDGGNAGNAGAITCHALVADGVFYPAGSFRVLPPVPEGALLEGLRHRVLDYLCEEANFDPELAQRMRKWQHSGFPVHNQIRVKANDAEGRKQLARYMIRNPFALEKMTYDGKTGMVIYRSKFHASLKRNYQLLPAVKWLTLLLAHIPDKYEHLVRYYGWYSNRARGERKDDENTDTTSTLHLDETPLDRKSKANWARLIQKVYEADPLECPKCNHTMRIIAVIDNDAVIRNILKHLHRWDPKPEQPDHPARDPSWPTNTTIPLTYHPVPDIA
jgi:hypothetical protein